MEQKRTLVIPHSVSDLVCIISHMLSLFVIILQNDKKKMKKVTKTRRRRRKGSDSQSSSAESGSDVSEGNVLLSSFQFIMTAIVVHSASRFFEIFSILACQDIVQDED
jgi:hypothetical protein